MDSLTQAVLGAAVGEAVLGKKIGNKAILVGAIMGTIPDFDALAGYFTDTITAIEVHRSFTHSILFCLVAAPTLGVFVARLDKSPISWKDWTRLIFWALFTHPLLDSFTTWGTQLLWPMEYEIALKSIFVIDPLYTLPLLVSLILVVRRKKWSVRRRSYVLRGLYISTAYLLLTLVLKGVAHEKFIENLEARDISFRRVDTRPTPFNTILWTANVEVEDAFLTGYYSFFDDGPISFEKYPKRHYLLENLKHDRNVQRLVDISNGWYTIKKKSEGLFFNDLRFGKLNPSDPASNFVFSYELIPYRRTVRAVEVEKSPRQGKEAMAQLWDRMWGKQSNQSTN